MKHYDTSQWNPHRDATGSLAKAMKSTLQAAEKRIQAVGEIERRFNISNFDSGQGVEDSVRDELARLLPRRYDALAAVITNHEGATCGECDVTITNGFWLPLLKQGATASSRRRFVPVEAVYSVWEVKQSLTEAAFAEGMKKLVTYKRLPRERSEKHRLVENQRAPFTDEYALNPRFDVLLATRSDPTWSFEDAARALFEVNDSLEPEARVNMLVCLGEGLAYYANAEVGNSTPVLYPGVADSSPNHNGSRCGMRRHVAVTTDDALFVACMALLAHLHQTVLNTSGFSRYGSLGEFQREFDVDEQKAEMVDRPA